MVGHRGLANTDRAPRPPNPFGHEYPSDDSNALPEPPTPQVLAPAWTSRSDLKGLPDDAGAIAWVVQVAGVMDVRAPLPVIHHGR